MSKLSRFNRYLQRKEYCPKKSAQRLYISYLSFVIRNMVKTKSRLQRIIQLLTYNTAMATQSSKKIPRWRQHTGSNPVRTTIQQFILLIFAEVQECRFKSNHHLRSCEPPNRASMRMYMQQHMDLDIELISTELYVKGSENYYKAKRAIPQTVN